MQLAWILPLDLDLPDNVKLRLGTSQDLEIYHDASDSLINDNGTGSLKLQTGGSTKLEVTSSGVDVTGNIAVSGTVDGIDIAARDAVLTSTTTTAGAALPRTGGAMTGAITTNSTFDGRDVATDGSKLDGIEAGATADQTQSEINALGITATGLSGTPAISVANITTTGELRGPASFVVDPAAVGDNTGTVIIKGNLQVDGATTTINSTTLTVDDLNITLASGAANGTAANGAGITVDGASATITYNSTGDSWNFNKDIDVAGTGTFSGGNANNTDDANILTLNASEHARLLVDTSSTGGHRASLVLESNSQETVLSTTGSASELTVPVGDFTLDVAGDIILDADGADVIIKDGGTSFLEIDKDGDNARIKNPIADGDIKIQGVDGSSTITALTLDMSNAGFATFNSTVKGTDGLFTGNGNVGLDVRMGTDKRIIFQGNIGEIGSVAGFQATNTAGSANTAFGIRATDIRFATGSDERVRITDTGVGIGTTSPTSKLSIQSGISGSSTGVIDILQNTNGAQKQAASIGILVDNGGESTNAAGMFFQTASGGSLSERMRLTSSGGLELAYGGAARQQADSQAFSIITPASGGGQGIAFKRLDSNNDQGLGEISWSNNTQDGQANIRVKTAGAVNSTDMHFDVNNAGTLVTALSIDGSAGGNVGIGTDSPATPLHVKKTGSTSSVQEFLRLENHALGGAGAGSSINFHHYHAGGGPAGGALAASINAQNMASWPAGTPSSYSTGLTFSTLNGNTFAERMRIAADGDVLVGGTSTNLNVLSGTPKIQVGNGTGHSSIQWYSGTSHVAGLYFGDTATGTGRYPGYIEYRHSNDSMAFRVNGDTRLLIGSGEMVVNEDSQDYDFRVESNDNTHMLFVDGGNNRVGIGKAPATHPLEVGVFSVFDTGVVINEGSNDSDFRVESNDNTHMLFVDAGANRVGVGISPTETLHVNGRSRIQNLYLGEISSNLDIVQATSSAGLYLVGGGSDVTIGTAGFIFNEGGADRDFRVESDGHSSALMVNAAENTVCMHSTASHAMGSGTTTGTFFLNNNYIGHTTGSDNAALILRKLTYTGTMIRFYQQNSIVGQVSTNTTGTTYNTTSDRRLKDNIETITDGTDKLMAMNPVTHDWKADPEADTVHGFIAQEMIDIVPEAVSGDPEGDEMMSMDYGRITPVIVAALQDAIKEIQELKIQINKLEGK